MFVAMLTFQWLSVYMIYDQLWKNTRIQLCFTYNDWTVSVEYVEVDKKKFRCDRKALLCAPHTDAIRIHHDLDMSHDKQLQHSETICRKCYMRLLKLKKTGSEHTAQTAKYDIEKSSSIWTDFDPC